MHEALEVAKGAAVAAGEKIMEFYQKESTVQYKSDSSPVTAADQAANNIITQTLTNYFPQHAILSEESQDDGRRLENDWCWIIDPLDGTKEFIHGNGEFTVNIALTFRHRVVLGVIAVPVSKELYYAVQGEGAYVEKNGQVEKLCVVRGDFIQTNVVGTFHLLEAVRHYYNEVIRKSGETFRFLHVSTDEVYGSLGETGYFTEDTPYAPNSPYSASKAASDHLVRAYYHTYGLPTLTTKKRKVVS